MCIWPPPLSAHIEHVDGFIQSGKYQGYVQANVLAYALFFHTIQTHGHDGLLFKVGACQSDSGLVKRVMWVSAVVHLDGFPGTHVPQQINSNDSGDLPTFLLAVSWNWQLRLRLKCLSSHQMDYHEIWYICQFPLSTALNSQLFMTLYHQSNIFNL